MELAHLPYNARLQAGDEKAVDGFRTTSAPR
jgi:hypothetical protein